MSDLPCKVLLVYPKFERNSFWNYRKACQLVGATHPASPLGLITVAALLPPEWEVRLIDRNIEELTQDDIEWADMVMSGGMQVQQKDTLQVISLAHAAGTPVMLGGPDITTSPHIYDAADILVLGEAEGIMDEVVAAWESGTRQGTFTSPKFQVDVSKTPRARFDLLKLDRYFLVGVQFSRGCPFMCEFCDIIELYGRVPRTKTAEQMLHELDALYALGHRGFVDFVDDNLIGNKKAIKAFLPHLIAWQKAHNYPFKLTTEASLNLADDDALLAMLRDANFVTVFIGIESPDPDVLVSTQKKQNTRRDIAESVRRIYEEGIFVIAGFIVGFDEEPDNVAAGLNRLIRDCAIPISMVSLLVALPSTQLTRRLVREQRLHPNFDRTDDSGDQCVTGLNFETLRPRENVLSDYLAVIEETFAPKNYFARLRHVGRLMQTSKRPWTLSQTLREIRLTSKFMLSLHLRHPSLIPQFWRSVALGSLRNPGATVALGMMFAMYAHVGPFARYAATDIRKQIEEVKAGTWTPPLADVEEDATPEPLQAAS